MPSLAQPSVLRLAQRLRDLRELNWPEAGLTQAALAKAFSIEERVSSATVSSWENLSSPKVPPRSRLTAYARFFATHRSVDTDPPRLLPLDELTDDERDAYEGLESELVALRNATRRPSAKDEVATTRSWHFSDVGPVTLICAQLPKAQTGSLANPADPNYTELLSYADLDALVELHGHIRAENPAMNVFFKLSSQILPDDLSGHLVLLGGIGWNEITQRLSDMTSLPIRQVEDPAVEDGEIFVVDTGEEEQKFFPKRADDGTLIEDVGLFARTPNPLNYNRSLSICNGVHSRGVLGAVRTLTDARLRDSNERYIVENFVDPRNFAMLMRVSVIAGQAITPDFQAPGSLLYRWPAG
jgi:transcriptional regulator with XRE-family HTH domain